MAASFLVIAFATALVALAAGAGTALLRPGSKLDAAVVAGVLALAELTMVGLVAGGVLRHLGRGTVLALLAVWAIVVVVALVRVRPDALRRPRGPGRPSLDGWAVAALALAAAALGWRLLVAVLLPPYAYDALTYHLTTVATWIQQGNLDPTTLSLCCARYPANVELVAAWPPLLTGNDTLVDTVQIGFAVLGALAVAGIARTAGLRPGAAATAAALFAVTPIVLAQSSTNYADVAVAATALAALHLVLRAWVDGRWRLLLPAGLAIGFVLGTKGTGALWAATLLMVTAAALAVAAGRGRLPARAALAWGGVALAGALLLGSWWYARNWIDTGNPVYPFRVEVAGTTVFDGPTSVDDVLTVPDVIGDDPAPVAVLRSWAGDLDFWHQGPYDYEQRLGGLGPLWPWLGLPLLAVLVYALVRRRSPALMAAAAIAVVFLLQPYRWWSRFTITLAAAGVLAVVAVAEHARPALRRALLVAALLLAAAGALLASYEIDPTARAEPLPARDVVGLIDEPRSERTIGRLFFPEYAFLDEVPADAAIAVDLQAPAVRFVYPFFGPDLERRVTPAGATPLPDGAWVVTGAGRPLDRRLAANPRYRLASARRGVHAWQPVD